MTSPQQLLREHGLRPQKALGQNFLVHSGSADKIANWAGVQEGEWVLEIGPGLGALTEALARKQAKVIAVEKDRGLVKLLRDRFPKDPPWKHLHHMDALKFSWSEPTLPTDEKIRVVSNLPYSVSTPLLEKLLEGKSRISSMSLLLQKEVADRVCAPPNSENYGRLSIWIQTLCEVEKGPKISPGSFYPVPDVDSVLLRLTPRDKPLVEEDRLPSFLQLVALLFQHRRKTIRNGLRDAKREDWNVDEGLTKANLDPSRRPETLDIQDFIKLSDALTSS